MNIRVRFRKYGVLKFIGHLDVMRYFQKAIRRADIDICYSEGYSPHMIMSFASPLSLEFFCIIILIIPEKCVLSVTKSHKYSFAWGILIEKKRKEDTSCMILSLSVRERLA